MPQGSTVSAARHPQGEGNKRGRRIEQRARRLSIKTLGRRTGVTGVTSRRRSPCRRARLASRRSLTVAHSGARFLPGDSASAVGGRSPQSPRPRNPGACRIAHDGASHGADRTQHDGAGDCSQRGVTGALLRSCRRRRQRQRQYHTRDLLFHASHPEFDQVAIAKNAARRRVFRVPRGPRYRRPAGRHSPSCMDEATSAAAGLDKQIPFSKSLSIIATRWLAMMDRLFENGICLSSPAAADVASSMHDGECHPAGRR